MANQCKPKLDIDVSEGSTKITCICEQPEEGSCKDDKGCVPHYNFDSAKYPNIDLSDAGTAGSKMQVIVKATGGNTVEYSIEFYCSCGKHNSDTETASGHIKYVRPLWQDILSFGITLLVDKIKR